MITTLLILIALCLFSALVLAKWEDDYYIIKRSSFHLFEGSEGYPLIALYNKESIKKIIEQSVDNWHKQNPEMFNLTEEDMPAWEKINATYSFAGSHKKFPINDLDYVKRMGIKIYEESDNYPSPEQLKKILNKDECSWMEEHLIFLPPGQYKGQLPSQYVSLNRFCSIGTYSTQPICDYCFNDRKLCPNYKENAEVKNYE